MTKYSYALVRIPKKQYRRKRASIGEHLVLPGIGAGVSGLATLLSMYKTKSSLKEKLKRLIRNATLGAMAGGGLELGRMGLTGLGKALNKDNLIEGDPEAEGHFLRYK